MPSSCEQRVTVTTLEKAHSKKITDLPSVLYLHEGVGNDVLIYLTVKQDLSLLVDSFSSPERKKK